jgi:hypothetical protein
MMTLNELNEKEPKVFNNIYHLIIISPKTFQITIKVYFSRFLK